MYKKHNINLNDDLFYRNLKQSSALSLNIMENFKSSTIYDERDTLMKIQYTINSHGYRSKEFTGRDKLMTLGCSQTHGHGMINELTWSHFLSKKLNMDFVRLALGGESIQSQVNKAFLYFKEFGNPEIIVGTFPLFRLEMPEVLNKFETKNNFSQNLIKQVFLGDEEFIKYSKSPHNPNTILPDEVAVFYNFMFIQILEQYCKSNNIKFIWNIWEDHDYEIYNYIKNNKKINHILKNYCVGDQDKIKTFNINGGVMSTCHTEYKNHILFKQAADVGKNGNSHWGIHKHIHVAEDFANMIQSI